MQPNWRLVRVRSREREGDPGRQGAAGVTALGAPASSADGLVTAAHCRAACSWTNAQFAPDGSQMVPEGRVRDTKSSCNFNAGKSRCFDEVGVCGHLFRRSQGNVFTPGVRIERQVGAVVGNVPDCRQKNA